MMVDNFFIPINDNSTQEERIIWSTEKIEQLISAMNNGIKFKGPSPFYEGNINWRKGNIVFEYTEEELNEIKKCAKDIIYFAENYATVMTDRGLQRIKLYDYQKDLLRHLVKNRFNIVLACRQVGKTICTAIFLVWYLLFNFDKNSLVLANKGATTKEIIDKIKVILANLPFFLKPGILKNDVFEIKFDNGCRLVGQTTTHKAGIGFTIHLLFLDEFAHIPHTFLDSFFENVYPTISSSKISKVVITSTFNGYNKFYTLYDNAVKGLNEFAPFRIDWWQVPGRDEKWKEQEIKNLGSLEAFNRQYGNQVIASSNLLLNEMSLKWLHKIKKKYIYHDLEEFDNINMDMSKYLFWDPDFDLSNCKDKNKFYVFSIDIADGSHGDYSIINIFQLDIIDKKYWQYLTNIDSISNFFCLKQIARFSSNEHSIEDFSKVLYTLAVDVFYNENTNLIIEWNYNGALVLKYLQTVFLHRNDFDIETVCKFKHKHDAKVLNYGLKLRKDNKPVLCQNFKKAIELKRIILTDEETIRQFETFGKLPTGSYGGQLGHDDLAMSSINVVEFFNTANFFEIMEEMLDIIPNDLYNEMEQLIDTGKLGNKNIGDDNLDYDIYDLLN